MSRRSVCWGAVGQQASENKKTRISWEGQSFDFFVLSPSYQPIARKRLPQHAHPLMKYDVTRVMNFRLLAHDTTSRHLVYKFFELYKFYYYFFFVFLKKYIDFKILLILFFFLIIDFIIFFCFLSLMENRLNLPRNCMPLYILSTLKTMTSWKNEILKKWLSWQRKPESASLVLTRRKAGWDKTDIDL